MTTKDTAGRINHVRDCDHPTSGPEGKRAREICRRERRLPATAPLALQIAVMQELAVANIKAIGDARNERIAALLATMEGK
jgi:hypothetical protein